LQSLNVGLARFVLMPTNLCQVKYIISPVIMLLGFRKDPYKALTGGNSDV